MRKPTILSILLLLFSITPVLTTIAQDKLTQPNLRFYLSEDKSSYAGMVFVNQIWTRYTWNNPDIRGSYPDGMMDIGLRRSRLIFYTQLMDKVFIYTQVGADGVTFKNSGNPNISLYNAQTEYFLIKDKLHLGFGLSTWNGISRYNNSKLLEFLMIDNPGFTYPTGGKFDRFGRQMAIYAKGTLDKVHYRLSVARPFEVSPVTNEISGSLERNNDNLAWKGYINWQFLDTESHTFPYMTMNNLGRSRLFNLGAGFYYHSDGMEDAGTDSPDYHDVFLFSTDLFLDLPVGNDGAITTYLGYFNYSFGPDYIRAAGKMNITAGETGMNIPQGPGNAEWEIGTGRIIHLESGYMLPGQISTYNLQPFGALTYKNFEALDDASLQYAFGLNLLHNRKHNIKWTLQYSNRPVYLMENDAMKLSEYRGQLILQTQVWF